MTEKINKIIKFFMANRGAITLAAITFAFSLTGAFFTSACMGGETATAMAAPITGTTSLLCLNWLCRYAGYEFPFSKDAAVTGILIGTALTIIIF